METNLDTFIETLDPDALNQIKLRKFQQALKPRKSRTPVCHLWAGQSELRPFQVVEMT